MQSDNVVKATKASTSSRTNPMRLRVKSGVRAGEPYGNPSMNHNQNQAKASATRLKVKSGVRAGEPPVGTVTANHNQTRARASVARLEGKPRR